MMVLLTAHRDLRRGLVHRRNRRTRERLLCLPAFHRGRRDRRVCFARSFFLLRLSRARPDPDFSAHRHLGSGQSHAAAWKITIYLAIGSFILLLGLILLYRSVPEAARSFDLRVLQKPRRRPDSRRRAAQHLPAAADRIRHSGFALPVSHLGAGSLRLRARAGGDAARRRAEKIRTLRSAAPRPAAAAGRRAALDQTLLIVLLARQHHLRRPGHDRAEAARLDARLFERDAHGLHFSRDRQRQHCSERTARPF